MGNTKKIIVTKKELMHWLGYLSVAELAAELKCSRQYVYRLIEEHGLNKNWL